MTFPGLAVRSGRGGVCIIEQGMEGAAGVDDADQLDAFG
jgi:hypothetical protein